MPANEKPNMGAEGTGDGTNESQRDIAIEKLKSDLRSLRHDLESAARTVNELSASAATEAMSQAQAQMEQLRARLDELAAEARAYGSETTEAIRQHVQERPFASLAIAMVTGFVLAHLMRR